MLIPGFNLAASNYRRSRREVILAAGMVAALSLLLVGQLALWAALRRGYSVEDVAHAVRRARLDPWVGPRGEADDVRERLARLEAELRRHQEEVRAAQASVPGEAIKRYEAKVGAYNQILEASAFSWTGLLVELERSVPPFVSLGEIHPDLGTGQVNLRGVARSFDDLSLFLRGLEERIAFREVYLLRQTERKGTPGGQEGLDFSISLGYQGRKR